MKALVVGTESSGSVFVSKIVAHVTGIAKFGAWDGYGIKKSGSGFVLHMSLPTGRDCVYPEIDPYDYSHIVITTRCNDASIKSKMRRWGKGRRQAVKENEKAAKILIGLLQSEANVFVFSYEAMVLLDVDYLKRLYEFLGSDEVLSPQIKDGNAKYYK